jgi:quercetin dioxygenase-like cupin family protein
MAGGKPRKRLYALGFTVMSIVAATALVLSAAPASGQSSTPAPQVVRQSRFQIADAPAVAEVVQQVVNFPPGAWTSPHSHGGQAINLVMEGEITFRRGDFEQKYAAGQAWSDPTGDVHAAGNQTGAVAHLLTNFLLPVGATQTTVRGESKLEPKVEYQARFPVVALPASAEVIQQAADFEPGASTGPTRHRGQAVHIVVFGEITYQADGQERIYKAGDAWQDAANHAYAVGNQGSDKSRLFTTVLLPEGMELTQQADASEVPPSGATGQEGNGSGSTALIVTITAGVLALAGAVLLFLRRSRTTN